MYGPPRACKEKTLGHDIVEQVRRGDLDKMSFAFKAVRDAWPTRDRRELIDVDLRDVSIVTHPAYEATTVALRGGQSEPIELRWYTDELSLCHSCRNWTSRAFVLMP